MSLLLMAPALLLLLAVFLWPILDYAWLSLQAQSVFTGLEPVPVGLANWRRLLGDGGFWQDAGGGFTRVKSLTEAADWILSDANP